MPPIFTAADLLELTKTTKSVMLFGPQITGKTRSLWTLIPYLYKHNLGKLHVFDLDLKCESLVMKCEKEKLLDHLVVHRLGIRDDLSAANTRAGQNKDFFLEFQKQLNAFHNMVEFTTGKWKPNAISPGAVFIDSMTTYCDMVMEFILGSLGHSLNAPGTDARDDYGRAMAKIEETVKSLKSLPCITGWIAHAELKQSGLDGKITRLPLVTGQKLAPKLAKEFNCIIYSPPPTRDAKGVETYRWQVHGGENGVDSAGVTSRDDLPTFIEPDFERIFG